MDIKLHAVFNCVEAVELRWTCLVLLEKWLVECSVFIVEISLVSQNFRGFHIGV